MVCRGLVVRGVGGGREDGVGRVVESLAGPFDVVGLRRVGLGRPVAPVVSCGSVVWLIDGRVDLATFDRAVAKHVASVRRLELGSAAYGVALPVVVAALSYDGECVVVALVLYAELVYVEQRRCWDAIRASGSWWMVGFHDPFVKWELRWA